MKDDNRLKEDQNKNRFISNSKYFTISIYTILTVLACTFIVRSIFMWEQTSAAFSNIINWMFPYLAGIFIACLLYPMTVFFRKNIFDKINCFSEGVKKGLSILTTYVIFIGAIAIIIGVVMPQLLESITELINNIPAWYNKILDFTLDFSKKNPNFDVEFIIKKLQEFGTEFLSTYKLQEKAQEILVTVVSTSVSVVSLTINMIISLMISIYLLIDLTRIQKTARMLSNSIVEEELTDKVAVVVCECYNIFASFVSGKMVDSTIIGILCFIVMTIMKLPYGIVISVVVGITNMIPYFGPFIGAVPGAFLLLMYSPVKMLMFLVLILVLQQFDGLYLGPKILGDSTGLRPAWIIFSVAAGGAVCGAIGMFIGVPVAAVIGHLINIWMNWRTEKRNIRFEEENDIRENGQTEQAEKQVEKMEKNTVLEQNAQVRYDSSLGKDDKDDNK